MGNMFTIEIFRERLKKLMTRKGFNITTLADALEIDRKTVEYWLRGKKGKDVIPSIDKLFRLSIELNVSVDYLIGRDDYLHFGNKEISESTGLSEHAIEVLRFLKSKSGLFDGGIAFGPEIDNYSWKNVEMINTIFENWYEKLDDMKKDKRRPLSTVLAQMYEYIHASDLEYIHSESDVNPLTGTVQPHYKKLNYDRVYFNDKSTQQIRIMEKPTKLFQASEMYNIQQWLISEAENHEKGVNG